MQIQIDIKLWNKKFMLIADRQVTVELPEDAAYGAENSVVALVRPSVAAAIDEYMDKISQEATHE